MKFRHLVCSGAEMVLLGAFTVFGARTDLVEEITGRTGLRSTI